MEGRLSDTVSCANSQLMEIVCPIDLLVETKATVESEEEEEEEEEIPDC